MPRRRSSWETRARLILSTALIEREQALREHTTARKRLAALWANPEPRFNQTTGDLEAVPPLLSFETLAARIRGNPELARWNTEIQPGKLVSKSSAPRPSPTSPSAAGCTTTTRSAPYLCVHSIAAIEQPIGE